MIQISDTDVCTAHKTENQLWAKEIKQPSPKDWLLQHSGSQWLLWRLLHHTSTFKSMHLCLFGTKNNLLLFIKFSETVVIKPNAAILKFRAQPSLPAHRKPAVTQKKSSCGRRPSAVSYFQLVRMLTSNLMSPSVKTEWSEWLLRENKRSVYKLDVSSVFQRRTYKS